MVTFRIVIALVLAACSNSLPGTDENSLLSADEKIEIARAEQRWNERRPASYTYEVRSRCICPQPAGPWVEVNVIGDSVVGVNVLTTDPGEREELSSLRWSTVPKLFESIRAVRKDDLTHDISATYDDQFGYPTRISRTCGPDFNDCGTVSEARNLKALP